MSVIVLIQILIIYSNSGFGYYSHFTDEKLGLEKLRKQSKIPCGNIKFSISLR